MNFPSVQTYNFFEDPYKVLDFVDSLEFKTEQNGKQTWPGLRTDFLHNIDYKFFNHVCTKQLRLFYSFAEMNDMTWQAEMQFQKIKPEDVLDKQNKKGWIHRDTHSTLTTIIYLTPNCFKSGTSIFKNKKIGDTETEGEYKIKFYTDKDVEKDDYISEFEETNNKFEEVAKFNSVFNSCIMFDGSHPHGANFDFEEERLTLITFFTKISAPRFPVPETWKVV